MNIMIYKVPVWNMKINSSGFGEVNITCVVCDLEHVNRVRSENLFHNLLDSTSSIQDLTTAYLWKQLWASAHCTII